MIPPSKTPLTWPKQKLSLINDASGIQNLIEVFSTDNELLKICRDDLFDFVSLVYFFLITRIVGWYKIIEKNDRNSFSFFSPEGLEKRNLMKGGGSDMTCLLTNCVDIKQRGNQIRDLGSNISLPSSAPNSSKRLSTSALCLSTLSLSPTLSVSLSLSLSPTL